MDLTLELLRMLGDTSLSVLPIAAFMLFFHRVVLRRQFAQPAQLAIGFLFMLAGLGVFLLGLEQALFPVGRLMVDQLVAYTTLHLPERAVDWWDYRLIFAFAFCLAFGAAIAEPALLAVARRVDDLSGGAIRASGLRVAAALGVGIGVTVGCMRIAAGVPLLWCVGAAYAVIIVQTVFAPRVITSVAYDVGGVTTSAITVPVVTALGLGLAQQVPGRSELYDGFGLLVLAATYPVMTVLAYAQITAFLERRTLRRHTPLPEDQES